MCMLVLKGRFNHSSITVLLQKHCRYDYTCKHSIIIVFTIFMSLNSLNKSWGLFLLLHRKLIQITCNILFMSSFMNRLWSLSYLIGCFFTFQLFFHSNYLFRSIIRLKFGGHLTLCDPCSSSSHCTLRDKEREMRMKGERERERWRGRRRERPDER